MPFNGMGFFWLSVAVVTEVLATSLLPKTDGFRRWSITCGVIALYLICFISLSKAMLVLSIGLAYALWSGLGIVLVNIVGVVFFQQKAGKYTLAGITLIVTGCIFTGIFK